MKLIEPWTFLGVNILEWHLGFIVFMLVSLTVKNIADGMPIVLGATIGVLYLISLLRRTLRNNHNVVVENLMYVWDVGVLKQKLICPQTTSKITFRFLLILIAYFCLGQFLSTSQINPNELSSDIHYSISLTAVAIIFFGLITNYISNGGDKGR